MRPRTQVLGLDQVGFDGRRRRACGRSLPINDGANVVANVALALELCVYMRTGTRGKRDGTGERGRASRDPSDKQRTCWASLGL